MFAVGDKVRLRGGRKPLRVVDVRNDERIGVLNKQYIRAVYLNSHPFYADNASWRIAEDFVHYESTEGAERKEEMSKLYEVQIDGETHFGTLLARNSQGWPVLEVKGIGRVSAFDPSTVKEVVPYTVEIVSGATGSKAAGLHYIVKPGALAVGECVVFGDGSVGRVRRVDTRHPNGATARDMRKIVTEPVPTVDSGTLSEDEE